MGQDQSIIGMKSFTSTVNSNGIQYSLYDNSSAFLASGRVKAISDINSSVDLSKYYNKTQTYSQTETINQVNVVDQNLKDILNSNANIGVSYTKRQDDAFLLFKVDKTQLIDSYIKDELLGEKADTIELSNYMTLGTSQTINANKIFNNACRFVSSIDGMSTVTGSSFVKSGADDTVVLLGAVFKADTALLDDYVMINSTQYFDGEKTFNANVNATGFVKTNKDDTSVLLAGGGDALLSSIEGVQIKDIINLIVSLNSNISISTATLVCTTGSVSNSITPPASPSTISYFIVNEEKDINRYQAQLNAAGLSEFQELCVYIHERKPKPIVDGLFNQIVVGSQYLQDLVKNNDDELIVQSMPPEPITPPIRIAANLIIIPFARLIQPLLPSNINDGGNKFQKLRKNVVYNIGLYFTDDFMRFMFASFSEELRSLSKHAQMLKDDGGRNQNITGYIS
ncbi:MAG: hypothetical protein EZS28_021334 [Streblomastix strix]|uniref:Uncharacterized protein n=1 Tax=Streblomastix strix TaxID=222440 RepID=A0A5J4VKX1_9EUKA|nr:MAG: hypothetical protein EZS28_021334 [Streblomastix strix]